MWAKAIEKKVSGGKRTGMRKGYIITFVVGILVCVFSIVIYGIKLIGKDILEWDIRISYLYLIILLVIFTTTMFVRFLEIMRLKKN